MEVVATTLVRDARSNIVAALTLTFGEVSYVNRPRAFCATSSPRKVIASVHAGKVLAAMAFSRMPKGSRKRSSSAARLAGSVEKPPGFSSPFVEGSFVKMSLHRSKACWLYSKAAAARKVAEDGR